MEQFANIHRKLKGGFFLAAMRSEGDGAFCAARSDGCKMIQFGLRLAEPPAFETEQGAYRKSILPASPKECTALLAEECRRARSRSAVLTCLNLASPKLEWVLEAAQCFVQAGGDLIELNVHGGYSRYLEIGKERAMVLPENQPELFRWVAAFAESGLPWIVKLDGRQDREAVLQALDKLASFNLLGVHVNVRNEATKKPDLEFAHQVRKRYSGFLLVTGYVRSAADAAALFEAGIDMVGIAEPTIQDPCYIFKIAQEHAGK